MCHSNELLRSSSTVLCPSTPLDYRSDKFCGFCWMEVSLWNLSHSFSLIVLHPYRSSDCSKWMKLIKISWLEFESKVFLENIFILAVSCRLLQPLQSLVVSYSLLQHLTVSFKSGKWIPCELFLIFCPDHQFVKKKPLLAGRAQLLLIQWWLCLIVCHRDDSLKVPSTATHLAYLLEIVWNFNK